MTIVVSVPTPPPGIFSPSGPIIEKLSPSSCWTVIVAESAKSGSVTSTLSPCKYSP